MKPPSRSLLFGALVLPVVLLPAPVGAVSDQGEQADRIPGEVVVLVDRSAPPATLSLLDREGAAAAGRTGMVWVLWVPPGTERATADRLAGLPGVLAAGPNLIYRPLAAPNDPFYPDQWGLHQIGAAQAHDLTRGAGVRVAVIDSGVAYQAWAGGGRAQDLACKTIRAPYDFISDDSFPEDMLGHGTAVAAVAVGCADDGYGAAGVAPAAELMPLRVCTAAGDCPLVAVLIAIIWAADHGAGVINLSLGSFHEPEDIERQVVLYAIERGSVVVAASGNSGREGLACPACLPEVVAAGATLEDGSVAGYSTGGTGAFGKRLDLVAPGGEDEDREGDGRPDGVLAETYQDYCQMTRTGSSFENFVFEHCYRLQGTSFAAPHAAGVAALIRARHPGLHPLAVGTALRQGAVDIGPAGWDSRSGWGRLWAPGALARAARLATPDSVGYQDPISGRWTLNFPEGAGSFFYGDPADIPIACDWDGDGVDTPGLYRSSTGFLHLRNSNTQGISDIEIFYGDPGDLPVCGDWNGDGTDTIGIYRPSEARFFLRNSNDEGFADLVFTFGNPGDKPFAGDWNGDGISTVGLYREETGRVYIRNSNTTGVADFDSFYGNPGDRFVVGDWDGDGRDSFGIFRPSESTFYLSNTIGQGVADVVIAFGEPQANPVAGKWR